MLEQMYWHYTYTLRCLVITLLFHFSVVKLIARPLEDTIQIKAALAEAMDVIAKQPHKSLQIAEEALRASRDATWPVGIAKSARIAGIACLNKGDVPLAIKYFNDGLKVSKQAQLLKHEGNFLYAIGAAYVQMGSYGEAFRYQQQSADIFQKVNDSLGIADAYSAMGITLTHEKVYEKANVFFEKAVAMLLANKDTFSAARFLGYLATNYLNIGKNNEAYITFRKSLELNSSAEMFVNFGNYFVKNKKYDSGLYYYQLAMPLLEADSNILDVAKNCQNIAWVKAEQGQMDEAETLLKRGLGIVKYLSNVDNIGALESALADFYAKKKDFAKAWEHQQEATKYKDSVLNIKTAEKLAQYASQFELKEILEHNKTLIKDNELQKLKVKQRNGLMIATIILLIVFVALGFVIQRNAKLRNMQEKAELEQKQLRAQMNPHFIFNCLNSIQHFVVAGDVRNANKYLTGFASLMRQTLEHSKAGDVILSKELAYINNYLALELMRYDNKFVAEVICDENIDKESIEIPAMIVQPFIENSIRHGLCYLENGSGLLRVHFYRRNDNLYCDVDDNGIGRERSKLLKENTHLVYESQGMELTSRRLELVSRSSGADYTISIKDKKDNNGAPTGTCVTIKFAINT
jgi:tetratricopeptide (TPR) repeat protein